MLHDTVWGRKWGWARRLQAYRRALVWVAGDRQSMKFADAKNGQKTGDGHGVGFFIPVAEPLAADFARFESLRTQQDKSVPHATFLYVGKVPQDRQGDLVAVAQKVLATVRGPVTAFLAPDAEYFRNPAKGETAAVMPVARFSHDLAALRWKLRDALQDMGFTVDDSFPLVYRPHVTLGYLDGVDATLDKDLSRSGGPFALPRGGWQFDGMEVWGLPEVHEVHFLI